MTDPMDSPRPATTKLHRKLKDRMYRHAEKHNITGFEAAGVMLALATEVMASALVRDGLLQCGADWAEEAGEVAADATETTEAELRARIQELTKETEMLVKGMDVFSDHCAKLTEANTQHLARIAQLEEALRTMADFALIEIKEHQARLAETVVTGVTAEELRIKELEVLRQFPWLTAREARIKDLLHRCGLGPTLPTQEPQP